MRKPKNYGKAQMSEYDEYPNTLKELEEILSEEEFKAYLEELEKEEQ